LEGRSRLNKKKYTRRSLLNVFEAKRVLGRWEEGSCGAERRGPCCPKKKKRYVHLHDRGDGKKKKPRGVRNIKNVKASKKQR